MTRDINLIDRFAGVTNRIYQNDLCQAAQALTRQALQDGFDVEDIKAILGFMVECEVDVAADVYDSEQYDKRYAVKKS